MPEIRVPKKNKTEKPKPESTPVPPKRDERPNGVVSAYSEEGQRRIASEAKKNKIFKIVLVCVFVVAVIATFVLVLMGESGVFSK